MIVWSIFEKERVGYNIWGLATRESLTLTAAHLAANHVNWSAQEIAYEYVRRSSHVLKWTISWTSSKSEYVNHKRYLSWQRSINEKERTGASLIMALTSTTFQFYWCTWKKRAKYGHWQKTKPNFSPSVTVCGGISKLLNGNISWNVRGKIVKLSHYGK